MNEAQAKPDSFQWSKWRTSGAVGDMNSALLRQAEALEIDTHFKGVLTFHSETGTEGGYWGFQDERFITKTAPNYGVWGNQKVFDSKNPNRQGLTRDDTEVLHGETWDPLPDPVQLEEDYFLSSLFRGEGPGDKEADKRLMDKYKFTMKYASDRMNEQFGEGNWQMEDERYQIAVGPDGVKYFFGGTPPTEPKRPYGTGFEDITRATVDWNDGSSELRQSDTLLTESWSYDGLHVLASGDRLIIYDKNEPGKVIWQGEINLSSFTVFKEDAHGMWIHNRQIGEETENWSIPFFQGNPAALILGVNSIKDQIKYEKRIKE